MKNLIISTFIIGLGLLTGGIARANPCPPGNPPTNCAPPTGAILDLAGTLVPHTYRQYTATFTASAASTNLSFAFREDPAFFSLDDIAVTDTTTNTPVTVVNPGFESGIVGGAPAGWTFLNQFGAGASGLVSTVAPHSGSNVYRDGSIQAYDGITQALATTVGHIYEVTFWLNDDSGLTTFRQLSNNGNVTGIGGNGIDVLVYGGAIPTLPEPATLAILGIALGGLGFARRNKTITPNT